MGSSAGWDDFGLLSASLGSRFIHDRENDVFYVTAPDGTEVQLPGPDLRECLEWIRGGSAQVLGCSYARVLDASRERLLAAEQKTRRETEAAEGALSALLGLAHGERQLAIRADGHLSTLSLADRVLERSREAAHHDPALARELAEIGCWVAEVLNPESYGESRVRNVQALAAATRGHALRIAIDMRGARTAFRRARELLEPGDEESLEALEVYDLETIMRRDLRDFPGALALNERVIEGHSSCGQHRTAAQALQKRASILYHMDDSAGAIEALTRASEQVVGTDPGMLCLTVQHSLALALARAGRIGEAVERFAATQGLYRQFSSPNIDACRLWAQGLIAFEAGNPSAVVVPLTRARGIFESNGYVLDTALVSLDLTAALAGLGRSTEVRELAVATGAFMEAREVHPDAIAALAILQQTGACERLTRELLRDVAKRLVEASSRRPSVS